jgi:hypothetical protein
MDLGKYKLEIDQFDELEHMLMRLVRNRETQETPLDTSFVVKTADTQP